MGVEGLTYVSQLNCTTNLTISIVTIIA